MPERPLPSRRLPPSRSLTGAERRFVNPLIGGGLLDPDTIRVRERALEPPMLGRVFHSHPRDVYLSTRVLDPQAILGHELGHTVDIEGESVAEKVLPELEGFPGFHRGYDYGGLHGLREAHAKGTPMSDFGVEQQAMIVEDFLKAVRTRTARPVQGAYVQQLKNRLIRRQTERASPGVLSTAAAFWKGKLGGNK